MTSAHISKLLVQAALLLLSLTLSVSAGALAIWRPSRLFPLSLILAFTALAIAVMGVWAPVPFWPRMGFAWTFPNDVHISFDLRWCFLPPLTLAVGACVLVLSRHGQSHNSTSASGSSAL